MGVTNIDKLKVRELTERGRSVPSGTQAPHIADAGDTTPNLAALTSAQSVEAQNPTTAEYNALQADVAALHASVSTLETDGDAYTDRINKLIGVVEAFEQTALS